MKPCQLQDVALVLGWIFRDIFRPRGRAENNGFTFTDVHLAYTHFTSQTLFDLLCEKET